MYLIVKINNLAKQRTPDLCVKRMVLGPWGALKVERKQLFLSISVQTRKCSQSVQHVKHLARYVKFSTVKTFVSSQA